MNSTISLIHVTDVHKTQPFKTRIYILFRWLETFKIHAEPYNKSKEV